jgi:cysteine synthase
MNISNSILDAIGSTPLIRLNRIGQPGGEIYVKAEFMNPGCSSKDRTARGILEEAERRGALKPGGLVVEATSGNTGVALSMIAAVKGYRCIIVMPEENRGVKTDLMEAYGAKLVYTKPGAIWDQPDGPLGVAERIARENPGAFYANQFNNPANPAAHSATTADEIHRQTEGRLDTLIAGIGTSGTIIGLSRRLREKLPALRVVGVVAEGSIFSDTPGVGAYIEGITPDFIPDIYDSKLVDEIVEIPFKTALETVKELMRLEGIPGGISSGAAVAAAVSENKRSPGTRIAAILPDSIRNYPLSILKKEA